MSSEKHHKRIIIKDTYKKNLQKINQKKICFKLYIRNKTRSLRLLININTTNYGVFLVLQVFFL